MTATALGITLPTALTADARLIFRWIALSLIMCFLRRCSIALLRTVPLSNMPARSAVEKWQEPITVYPVQKQRFLYSVSDITAGIDGSIWSRYNLNRLFHMTCPLRILSGAVCPILSPFTHTSK
jgi:hypothetical protein